MKIMAINRTLENPISDFLSVDMIPDSAIIRDNKPFFIPGFASDWVLNPVIAFRNHRLGKNIAKKFASRYYDAYTLGLRMIPRDLLAQIKASNHSTGLATAFDGAFIHGEWLPIEPSITELNISVGKIQTKINISDLAIDQTIEQLSKYFTLKIGDIIIPCTIPIDEKIEIDTSIIGTINETECLSFRIK